MTMSPKQSVQFTLRFAPSAAGSPSGALVLSSNSWRRAITISLAGTAIISGQLSSLPASVSFGSVPVGQTANRSVSLTNSGFTSLTLTQLSVSGSAFQLASSAAPITLAPGQSASVSIAFKPLAAGASAGTVSAVSSASLSVTGTGSSTASKTTSISLSGSGTSIGQLVAAPASISFPSAQVGKSANQTVALTNSGGAAVQVNSATITGTGFSLSGMALPLTLLPGQGAAFSVAFSPASAGNSAGTLSIASNASNPVVSISLAGNATVSTTPGAVSVSPASLSFGSVQAGSSKTQSATLTNSGTSSVTISQVNVSGNGFSLSGINLPLTLSGNQSFTFGVLFSPQAAGVSSGSVALVTDAASASPSIALSGTGTAQGQLTISPANLSFGNVTVGASQSKVVTLSATGGSVTISSVAVSSSDFVLAGLSLPQTLAAGQTANVTLQFIPQASGVAAASASFTSNAAVPTLTEALTGTGVAAQQHSVQLSWTAGTGPAVGYYIYRSTTAGGPYSKLNSTPDAATSYGDTSVQAGQTYFYVTTAVDQSGSESDYSNEVQAAIPAP